MIFINSMKNLKIYKTPVFLPTLEDDKKRGSAILMMTPNYNSSKKLMNHPLFINKLRYSSLILYLETLPLIMFSKTLAGFPANFSSVLAASI